MAIAFGEPLIVLHAVPNEEFEAHNEATKSDSYFAGMSLEHQEDSAARYAGRVVERGIEEFDVDIIETWGRIGDHTEEILDEAADINASFVVSGGRRRSPVGKALFCGTTQEMLLRADMPVVTVMTD
jgi:nucleotide-binding universal stress UspA family protein